jgi:hypothetical protein
MPEELDDAETQRAKEEEEQRLKRLEEQDKVSKHTLKIRSQSK